MFRVHCYIYQIKCRPTNKCYVGHSFTFPTGRWYSHWLLCRQNRAAPRMQEAYNEYPSPIFWEYSILEYIPKQVTHREALNREGYWILQIQPELRLNERIPISTLTIERQRAVLRRINEGMIYRNIAAEFGISPAYISKIKKMHLE